MEILFGNVPQPKAAEPLYAAVQKHVSGSAQSAGDNEEGRGWEQRQQWDAPPVARGTIVPQAVGSGAQPARVAAVRQLNF